MKLNILSLAIHVFLPGARYMHRTLIGLGPNAWITQRPQYSRFGCIRWLGNSSLPFSFLPKPIHSSIEVVNRIVVSVDFLVLKRLIGECQSMVGLSFVVSITLLQYVHAFCQGLTHRWVTLRGGVRICGILP